MTVNTEVDEPTFTWNSLDPLYSYEYHFDLKTHTIDPTVGEIIPLKDRHEFVQCGRRITMGI